MYARAIELLEQGTDTLERSRRPRWDPALLTPVARRRRAQRHRLLGPGLRREPAHGVHGRAARAQLAGDHYLVLSRHGLSFRFWD